MNEKLFALLDTVQKTAVRAGDVASDAAYGVGKKAEALLSSAKLNAKIMSKEGEVEEALQSLGEMLYATHTGEPTDSDVLLAKLEEIDAMKAEIHEMKVRAGKAGRVCPVCAAEAREGDAFCRECGAEL